jgi:hypothetical protein
LIKTKFKLQKLREKVTGQSGQNGAGRGSCPEKNQRGGAGRGTEVHCPVADPSPRMSTLFLSSETKDLILKRQFVDRVLYDAANATLWRKIDDFGRSKMESELEKFRSLKEQVDPNEQLLSLQGGKFMDFMKNRQYPDSVHQIMRFFSTIFTIN